MSLPFGETLKRLRIEKGYTQKQLADRLHVERPSITNWEACRRIPDADMIFRIAGVLGVEAADLLSATAQTVEAPNVMLLDDETIILTRSLPVLHEALPQANIVGFTKPTEALEFITNNPVELVFLDIELGNTSGLDLCRKMLTIRPCTNIIFLTAYRDYSFDAWGTGACGFLLKPLDVQTVRGQLSSLRYPVKGVL